MNDDAFARLVAEEVKNRVGDSQREFLLLPENWNKWQRALFALSENLQGQLEDLADDEKDDVERYEKLGKDGVKLLAEALSEYENRRKKIERFKYHVENRIDDVTKMIALGPESADQEIKTLEFLRKAINAHREVMARNDIEPTAIDIALWASLDGKWDFDNIVIDDL